MFHESRPSLLPRASSGSPGIRGLGSASGGLKDLARESAELAERNAILDALTRSGGNVTRTAKALGISRATLQKRMKAYGLRESGA